MTRRHLTLLAAIGSALLLAGAFTFQALGYPPCKMCIWQRYPHVVATGLGLVAYFVPVPALLALGALAALTTAGVGLYHVGVEQRWWEGPSTCTSGDIGGLSPQDLMAQIMDAPLVRCDEIAWSLAGISMAGWNAILSLALAGVWVYAIRRAA